MKMTVIRKRTGKFTIHFPPNYSTDQLQLVKDVVGTFGFLMPFDRPITAGDLAGIVEKNYSVENLRTAFVVRQLKKLEKPAGWRGRRNR